MSLKDIASNIGSYAKLHSTDILTGASIAGLGFTIILVAKAAIETNDILDEVKEDLEYVDEEGATDDPEEAKAEIKKKAAKKIVVACAPAAASTAITVVCIISVNRISAKREAAMASIASVSQSALMEYKEATKKTVGNKKESDISHEATKETFNEDMAIRTGMGDDRCVEAITGQPFYSSIDYIRNKWHEEDDLLREGDDITLNWWLSDLQLRLSPIGDRLLWRYDPGMGYKTVHLDITSTFDANGKPAYYISYDRYPEYYR